MVIRIKLNRILFNIAFVYCLAYVLMRILLSVYLTESVKYGFLAIMTLACILALMDLDTLRRIGLTECVLLIIFVIYVLISSYSNGGKELLYITMEKYVFYMFPLFIIAKYVDKINWVKVLKTLSVFGIANSLVAIIEFITHERFFKKYSTYQVVHTVGRMKSIRVNGISGGYFLLAAILCVCSYAGIVLFIRSRWKPGLLACLMSSVGILASGSRGYYIAYFGGLVFIYLFFDANSISNSIVKAILFAILGIGVLYLLLYTDINTGINNIDMIFNRIRAIFVWKDELSNVSRMNSWIKSIKTWKTNLWFGVGASCTEPRYSGYIGVTESGVLKRLVEIGIIGTVLQYLTMLLPILASKKNTHKDWYVGLFFKAVLIAFFIEDLVLQQYTELEFTIITWTALAYLGYAGREENY